MKITKYATIVSALLASATCLAVDEAEVIRLSEPVEETAEYETFGSPLDQSVSAVSLEEIASNGDSYANRSVRVVTRVAQVCQKKGCFFIAQEGGSVVRVSFKDYGFFVPTDISGRRVTLVGEVVARDFTPDQAKHFAEDLGGPASTIEVGKTFEIVAESVRVPRGS